MHRRCTTMDFSAIDSSTIIMILEAIVILAMVILAGVSLFKNYKGKNKLSIDEILTLGQELVEYANYVYSSVSSLVALSRNDFYTEEEYKDYLARKLVEDFDELITNDPNCISNSALYTKLSYEDRVKLVESIVDKIAPNKSTHSNSEITEEPSNQDTDDNNDGDSLVDIGEHLV